MTKITLRCRHCPPTPPITPGDLMLWPWPIRHGALIRNDARRLTTGRPGPGPKPGCSRPMMPGGRRPASLVQIVLQGWRPQPW